MYYRFDINRSWVASRTASRVYLAAAILTLVFFACRIGIGMALALVSAPWSAMPAVVAIPLFSLLVAGVIATALIWVGMVYYWYNYDSQPDGSRGVWLLVIIVLGPIGSLIYYFAVYRKQVKPGTDSTH